MFEKIHFPFVARKLYFTIVEMFTVYSDHRYKMCASHFSQSMFLRIIFEQIILVSHSRITTSIIIPVIKSMTRQSINICTDSPKTFSTSCAQDYSIKPITWRNQINIFHQPDHSLALTRQKYLF